MKTKNLFLFIFHSLAFPALWLLPQSGGQEFPHPAQAVAAGIDIGNAKVPTSGMSR